MLSPPVRVCFVCSGNICRSPTAEVVFAELARRTGRTDLVTVDSAGTGRWHVGDDMDPRSRRTLVAAGYEVGNHTAKQFTAADLATRDLVVALDSGHYEELGWLAAQSNDIDGPDTERVLLRWFDPMLSENESPDVADPYYEDGDGFAAVLAHIQRSCEGLLDAIERAVSSGADSVTAVRPSQ